MKITDIRAIPVAVPLKPSAAMARHVEYERNRVIGDTLTSVIVEVTTDEGYTGIGESPAMLGAGLTADLIRSTRSFLAGKDPADINPLIQGLYTRHNLGRLHIHLASWAFSGVELALWDIAARSGGMPLYQLWGGAFRERVELLGMVSRRAPDEMAAEAARLFNSGFRALHTDLGVGAEEDDLIAMAAMRKGAPDHSVRLCADANQAWSTGVAVSVINRLEPLGIGWIEQPVMMHNPDGLKDVKNRVDVPIMGHESNWTMYDVLNVIKSNCVDYVKIDGRFDAGYKGARVSAGIAEAGGIQCAHQSFPQLGVALAGSLHIMAACPNFTLPYSMSGYMASDDVITGGPLYTGELPYIDVPGDVGLGVTLDPERVAKYNEMYLRLAVNGDA